MSWCIEDELNSSIAVPSRIRCMDRVYPHPLSCLLVHIFGLGQDIPTLLTCR